MKEKIEEIISDLLSVKDDIKMDEIDSSTTDLLDSCIHQLEQLIEKQS